jgi:hypothetical protein
VNINPERKLAVMRTANIREVALSKKNKAVVAVKPGDIELQEPPRKWMGAPVLTVEQLIRRACEHELLQRKMGLNPAPARLYREGESAAVDAAISLLQTQISRHTSWWDVVRMFLDQGSVASAKIALQYTAKADRVRRQEPQEPRKNPWWWLEGFRALVQKTNLASRGRNG